MYQLSVFLTREKPLHRGHSQQGQCGAGVVAVLRWVEAQDLDPKHEGSPPLAGSLKLSMHVSASVVWGGNRTYSVGCYEK